MAEVYNFTDGTSALKYEEFKGFLDTQDYSDCTRKAYLYGLSSYKAHGFEDITVENELKFKQMLIEERKKPKTINLIIHSLNAYNRWIGLPTIKEVRANDEPFAENGMELEDFHWFVDQLLQERNYHWYIITKLLAGTGLRIGEAVQVTYGDFRRGQCTVLGKGKKLRTVYFSHVLRETLYMFIKDKSDDEKMIPHSPSYVRNRYLRFKKQYGCKFQLHPHEFRHFFARQMFEATGDITLLKGLLGHESEEQTSLYIRKTHSHAQNLYSRVQNW